LSAVEDIEWHNLTRFSGEVREEHPDLERHKRYYLGFSEKTQESALRSGRQAQHRTVMNGYSLPEDAGPAETIRWTLDEFWSMFDTIAGNSFEARYRFEEFLRDIHATSPEDFRIGQQRLSEYATDGGRE